MSKIFLWNKIPVGMMLFQRTFFFPAPITSDEIVHGDTILNWIDEVIKDTPFVEISLYKWEPGYSDKNPGIVIIYKVFKLKHINEFYAFRHLALQDKNLN